MFTVMFRLDIMFSYIPGTFSCTYTSSVTCPMVVSIMFAIVVVGILSTVYSIVLLVSISLSSIKYVA